MSTPFWKDEDLHKNKDQLKRQISATDKKLTPINIDYENSICYIKGSGKEPYVITLDDCTCTDFMRRKLPCKHMYRLAHELGLFTLSGAVERTTVVQLRLKANSNDYLDLQTGEITTRKSRESYLKGLYDLSKEDLVFLYAFTSENPSYRFTEKHYMRKKDILQRLLDAEYIIRLDMPWEEKIASFCDREEILQIISDLDPDGKVKFNPRSQFKTLIKLMADYFSDKMHEIGNVIPVFTRSPAIENRLVLRREIVKILGGDPVIITDIENPSFTIGPSYNHVTYDPETETCDIV